MGLLIGGARTQKDFMEALDHAVDNAHNDVLSTAEYAKAPPEQRRALEENFKGADYHLRMRMRMS